MFKPVARVIQTKRLNEPAHQRIGAGDKKNRAKILNTYYMPFAICHHFCWFPLADLSGENVTFYLLQRLV